MCSCVPRSFCLLSAAMLARCAGQRPAQAQDWPAKPIRAFIPFGAGSATDIIPRAVFDQLGPALGQPIVVENRGGAGGALGVGEVDARGARRLHDPCRIPRRSPSRRGSCRICLTTRRRISPPSSRSARTRNVLVVQSVEGLEDGAGSRRRGESQSGHDQLRLGRRRHRDPCQRRTLSRQRRIRGDACSV